MRILILFLCSLAFSAVQAQDFYKEDLKGLLYLKMEFGGSPSGRHDGFKLGLTINHTYAPADGLGRMKSTGDALRHSLVDLEYSTGTGHFSRFNIGGMDALTYRTVLHQTQTGGSSRWPMGLSTAQVVIGGLVAIVGGYFIYDEVADDGDEEGDVDVDDEEDED